MKYVSIIIALVFLFTASHVNATKPKGLKSQDATDIAPNPEHKTQYTKQGMEEHISFSAYADGQKATRKFVRKMLVDGLRESFSTWKKGFTQFSDDEGFVRQGIVFCGSDDHDNVFPTGFSTSTGSLVEADGFGQDFDETEACSKEKCVGEQCHMVDLCTEGSVVATLARTIRAMGLNIHHQDVCDAVIFDPTTEFPKIFTTTLERYGTQRLEGGSFNYNGVEKQRFEYACAPKSTSDDPGARGAHFIRMQDNCFGSAKGKCTQSPLCTFFERENTCYAKESGQVPTDDDFDQTCVNDDNPDPWNTISEDTSKNAVRRATSYGLTALSVESTDYAYVTGCQQLETEQRENKYAGDYNASTGNYVGETRTVSKCANLRSLFLALNGNTQINAFRDLGMEEASEHWGKKVSEIKAYLVDFSYQLSNFRPISLEIFPFIENEAIEGCPMGTTGYEEDTTGDEEEPFCYKKSLDFEQVLRMDKTGQSFSRTHCFCRNGQLDDYEYDKVERDDLYLLTELSKKDQRCNKMGITMPISAYEYCKEIDAMGDTPYWKNTLESLRPAATESRTKIYSHVSETVLDRRAAVRAALEKTLPAKLDNSCGRIVNADSETSLDASKLMRSNKGGNCMPFSKLNEVLFRLEFETGIKDMGEYASETKNGDGSSAMMTDFYPLGETGKEYSVRFIKPAANPDIVKFHDFFCKSASFAEKSYSFRQLAYRWDRAQSGEVVVPEVGSDKAVIWYNKYDDVLDGNDKRYTTRYIVNGTALSSDADTNQRAYAEFCHPDWITQIGGDIGREDSSGYRWANPYPLLSLEINEAVFNTKLAKAAKTIVKVQQNDLWSFIEEQLTENKEGNIIEQLGNRAGKHFMKIWLDENTE